MKYETDKATGLKTATAETPVEAKALQYLQEHRPLFALAESYVISAFMAGYEAAQADAEASANKDKCGFCDGTGRALYGPDRLCNACNGSGKARPLAEVEAETMARMTGKAVQS